MSGIDIHTLRYAASKVGKLAFKLIRKGRVGGKLDTREYEQGVGAEMASRMLMEEAERLERAKKSR